MERKMKLGLIALVAIVAAVGGFALLAQPFSGAAADERAQDSASIQVRAETFAADYLTTTLGGSLDDMKLVDIRYEPAATELMTSITTGFFSTDPEDVWVVAWEQEGVANVTTGLNDGTASLVLVLRDGTGEVLSASAGVRQPEEQARSKGPLPTFREVYGAPPSAR